MPIFVICFTVSAIFIITGRIVLVFLDLIFFVAVKIAVTVFITSNDQDVLRLDVSMDDTLALISNFLVGRT
jgi:hypothetical protein